MYVSSHNICSNNRESEEMFEDRKGYLLVAHRSRTYIARNSLPFMSAWDHRWFIVGSVLIIFLVFCVPVLFVFVLCLVYLWIVHSLVFSNVYLLQCPKGKGQKNKQHNTLKTED
jgi:hypothetical protein